MTSRLFALFCALITIFVWASSFPAITLGLRSFDPLPLAALRFLIASTILLGLVTARAGTPTPPGPRDMAWFLFCGLLGIAIYNYLLNTGQKTVSPGAASFLIACQPLATALVAKFYFKERFGVQAWFGTLICLLGAGILSAGQPGGLTFGAGTSLLLLAAACSGSFFALQRPLIGRHGPLRGALWLLLCGTLWLSPWLPQGFHQFQTAETSAILALLFLGVFPGALAYLTWMLAVGELGAARAANLLFFMAPAAALISIPVVGTWPGPTTVVGGLIALIGVLIVHRSKLTADQQRSAPSLNR